MPAAKNAGDKRGLEAELAAAHERIAGLERVIEEDDHPDPSSFTNLEGCIAGALSRFDDDIDGLLTIM